MKVFRGSQAASRAREGSAIAIGNFDGIHLGHQALFRRAVQMAQQDGLTAVALTFCPHPARFFNPHLAPPLITTETQKTELIAAEGIDAVVIEPFDQRLARMTPEAFTAELLVGHLTARHVIVGKGFAFGHRRAGTLDLLRQLGGQLGFTATGIESVRADSIVVSSTKIREFILMGRVDGAATLLGRPFFLDGRVVAGAGRGRTIGVPTANMQSDNELVPARGVYAGRASLPGGSPYPAVINVGYAPTFGEQTCLRIEAHLLDFRGDTPLEGKQLRLSFDQHLRAERRFDNADQLVAAIRRDIDAAGRALRA